MGDLITSISTAITIANRLKVISDKIEDAELQGLLADLNLELAETKNRLSTIVIENTELKEKLNSLSKKLKSDEEYIQYKGASFKRKPSGGFEDSVYCSSCKVGMATMDSDDPYVCGKCSSFSGFESGELQIVLDELTKEYG